MRSFKLPLWALMVAVLAVGIGFAALKNPTELVASAVFTLTVCLLCVAVLVAIGTTGRKRLAYSAFALFGGMVLLMDFATPIVRRATTQTPTLVTIWTDYILSAISPYMISMNCTSNEADLFWQIGHTLSAVIVGFLASLTTLLVAASRREPAKG